MELQKSWMQQVVIFSFIFRWCGDRSFALPIRGGMSVEPSEEQVDRVTLEDARHWMIKYGMALLGQSVTTNEISKLQRRAVINVTGVLDTETKKLLLIPRCGVTEDDYKDQEYGTKRRKRFTLQGSKWNKRDLTYRFLSSTADLPVDIQQNILRKMINKWAEVSTLTVREADSSASDNDVDILISFVRGFHNDPYPFDGQGGTLAHAYYPHNNLGLSGDTHFDDDEQFTTGTSEGINLDWVAVHEFGHSLGLEHSNVRESIMYPWYKGYFPNIALTEDNILGIQALHGKPTRTSTPSPTGTQSDMTTGTRYYRRYWKYFDYKLEEGPSDINQYGLPSALQNMDAAFIWERNYKTCLRKFQPLTVATFGRLQLMDKCNLQSLHVHNAMEAQKSLMQQLIIFAFIFLWCSDRSFALPIGVTSVEPTKEQIDNFTLENARDWVYKYKLRKPGGATGSLTEEILTIQLRGGLNITGVLDDATKKLLLTPRCGVYEKEDENQTIGQTRRKKRFYLQGTLWEKRDLTYRFLESTADLPVDVQRNILRKMINKWAEVSTLNIREQTDPSVKDDDVDILIRFVRRFHNDPYPFDGPGGTLAHAYYPHNNKGLSGDAHFDDDERFTTGTSDGINLDWVAVHEFGHSMGLEHSNVRESIMYPWYKGYFPNIELTEDDILGIQALYGKPTQTPTPSPTPTPSTPTPTPTPSPTGTQSDVTTTGTAMTGSRTSTKATSLPVLDICKVLKFDSFLMGYDGKTYVFSGDYFWVLGVRLGVESGPTKITSKWKALKTPIDSAYANGRRTIFFKGSEYWKYYDNRLEEGPRDIKQYGLPSALQNMDAAFIWEGNKKTYFFKGGNYWRYNENSNSIDANYPRSISVWGLPHSMDTVISWSGNKRTYFFKNENYWKLDDGTLKFVEGYPRDITKVWMKCSS
ncbi:uncharacterized protein [Porites lutea]|uniref:uncharacterized protein n=1 Tax=Porites lutea TaxID=51062 RepID=UPI003CC53FB0